MCAMTASWMCEYYMTASQLPRGEYHMRHVECVNNTWLRHECVNTTWPRHNCHVVNTTWHTWLRRECVPHECMNTTWHTWLRHNYEQFGTHECVNTIWHGICFTHDCITIYVYHMDVWIPPYDWTLHNRVTTMSNLCNISSSLSHSHSARIKTKYVHTHTHTHTYICTHTYIYMYIQMYIWIISSVPLTLRTHKYVLTHTHTRVYTHTRIYIRVCRCTYGTSPLSANCRTSSLSHSHSARINTYIHTHTYTCIYTHTYIYMCI